MTAPWEEYGGQSAAAPWEEYAPQTSLVDSLKQGAGNLVAGAVRGAGSIGATLLYPFDKATDIIKGDRGPNVTGLVTGKQPLSRNEERRQAMDGGLQALGADPNSFLYGAGKLTGEIAGTAGAGGVLANGVRAVAGTRALTGLEPITSGIARGLETGGFRVGELAGTGLGTATRVGTGAAVGGAAAGLQNPGDAGFGALIGGALPGATQLAGAAGSALRGAAPKVSPQLVESARHAVDAGYVIPPATVNPTFMNRSLESISGKQATQQLASVRNNEVTEGLVRKALNIADDAPLNRATLEDIRKDAGKAYKAIADLPVKPAQQGSSLMNTPAQAAIKPRQVIEDLKQARNDAQTYFTAYNRSASPEHLKLAKEADALAGRLEKSLEDYAQGLGAKDLLPALREARKRIAQTYTVERALNEATGGIDAKVFARLFQKGKPLSGGLEEVGRFASAFPTVAKRPEQIGSPDSHNLRTVGSLMLGALGGAGMGPAGLAAASIPYIAPPIARSLMFSPAKQRGLLGGLSAAEEPLGLLTQGAYRSAPLLAGQ